MIATALPMNEEPLTTSHVGLLSSSRLRVPRRAGVSASLLSGTRSLGTLTLPSGTRLYIEGGPDAPNWVPQLLAQVCQLVELPQDWDSYGAPPVREAAVLGALELLAQVITGSSSPPQIVPTSQGGLQLEWHQGGVDLEVEVLGPGATGVYYLNSRTGVEWESTDVDNPSIAELVPRIH